MSLAADNLWEVVWARARIDPAEMVDALETAASDASPDFRTRLLIRDCLDALAAHWGRAGVLNWLTQSPERHSLLAIWRAELGAPGFAALDQRLMEPTRCRLSVSSRVGCKTASNGKN